MPDFSYIAVNKFKEIKRGIINSSSFDSVYEDLTKKGLDLISCEEQKQKKINISEMPVSDLLSIFFKRKITPIEKISFARHLGVMLKAGISIIEAVEVLESETASFEFKKIIKELSSELQKGKSLSLFLEKQDIFSNADLAILKSGEISGKLEESLIRIADDLKRNNTMKKKLKSAMTYPLIIVFTLIGISGFIIIFVLPKVGEVFKQMNLKIPLPTKILLAVGSFTTTYLWQTIISFLAVAGFLFFIFKFTKIGRKILLKLINITPIIKKIIYQMNMAQFIRSLSSLLNSGVPISESLLTSGKVFNNERYQKIIKEISKDIQQGISLSASFKKNQKSFGGLLVKMTSVGEKSGKLAEILEELALFYEEEVSEKLDNFATLVEPILMLIVGLGVGGMIISIIGPIYQMMGNLTP